MTLPAKLPITGGQIKAEYLGDSSMLSCGKKAGLAAGFKMSQFVGKQYANFIVVSGGSGGLLGVGTGYAGSSVPVNRVGGNFTGWQGMLCTKTIGSTQGITYFLLNNWKQTSYSFYCITNNKTYNFVKLPQQTNAYQITGAAATEFYNLLNGLRGKQTLFVVTGH